MYLGVPIKRMNVPWSQVDASRTGDGASVALKEMLTAVYQNNWALAAKHLSVTQVEQFGSAAAFLEAFRTNLKKAGTIRIYGRIDDADTVRFVIDGEDELAYRILTFTPAAGGVYILDNSRSPGIAQTIEASIFRVDKTLKLESKVDFKGYTEVSVGSEENPCRPVLIARVEAAPKALLSRDYVPANAALRFYQQCHLALETRHTQQYFDCFGPEGSARMGGTFAALSADKQTAFLNSAAGSVEPTFVLAGGSLTVLYYRRSTGPSTLLMHQDIVGTGTSYQLVNPMTSSVLDDVLNDKDLQTRLSLAASTRGQ